MSNPSPVETLAALLGPDTLVHEGDLRDAAARAHKGWLVLPLGHAAQVLRDGDTVATVDLEDLTLHLSLYARYNGADAFPIPEAERIVEEEMWPAWEARGYAIDGTCLPDNGWDASEELWVRNVKRTLGSLAAVAEELTWIARQERIQEWG